MSQEKQRKEFSLGSGVCKLTNGRLTLPMLDENYPVINFDLNDIELCRAEVLFSNVQFLILITLAVSIICPPIVYCLTLGAYEPIVYIRPSVSMVLAAIVTGLLFHKHVRRRIFCIVTQSSGSTKRIPVAAYDRRRFKKFSRWLEMVNEQIATTREAAQKR
ncbi:hypothetical protein COV04_00015 [Candidatus Uhrbacteria bacterium CG10_big_fil_rev_8_21_14_0_10_48_11]|uniref:Uncharacterized protein n=1 Tax=Candidatus Uhrbacteria bacterium CG10_big_fil_rev_8_21_14_0_10_48_11 TaxID=1975037 RepID=A0A2M8LFV4_9BACT|nr:MAG: hypothetical protein COV04_00015 [Candidatus Uhrbacteria bacterium CG10_big_fil_rev_8_21_14_0_10_48_11]